MNSIRIYTCVSIGKLCSGRRNLDRGGGDGACDGVVAVRGLVRRESFERPMRIGSDLMKQLFAGAVRDGTEGRTASFTANT